MPYFWQLCITSSLKLWKNPLRVLIRMQNCIEFHLHQCENPQPSSHNCSVLLCPAQSCFVLLCLAQSCFVLLSPFQSCSVLLSPSQSCSVLLSPAQSCSVLLSPAQSCSVLEQPFQNGLSGLVFTEPKSVLSYRGNKSSFVWCTNMSTDGILSKKSDKEPQSGI